ncbi:uncharacterized protein MONBRDRAFT_17089 [Monosiga brevicollis MX1]|uniref:NADH dehydrogenase [ubiquinone] 1 alpha subcomplex subunit 12 n=1 Tax=Monosiga brevicollis TaxID=81824 RepID=A9UPF6_MONBE|nr:uncharacterized protein MONBRDRAFT_17089 [Monosiga brevicollis MX1]EDQ92864.1 predicted protein [Monosiga brevicollis MX1]|eukprot:XP_001742626.1 hypothetical protein [Monosiga brevicollis MX1]
MANPNNLRAVIRQIQQVGAKQVFRDICREGKLMTGVLVGQDKFGNKYYEDKEQMFGNHRRVDMAREDFNASQVPPEWHRWLHAMTDDLPDSFEPRQKWQLDHEENLTDSADRYVAYSTVKPKIQSWKPE